jgi:hypothetical protein
MLWDTFKRGFDAWENRTAKLVEQGLRSPVVLAPSAIALGTVVKAKAAYDRAVEQWTGGILGLATKRDQERTLHALNQLESRLMDMEERLEAALADKKER